MSKARYRSTFSGKTYKVDVSLKVLIWDEEGIYYCYSPALDLTGYGKTEIDAKKSFELSLDEFVKYTQNKSTIFEELERLGWTVNKKKKRVSAPSEEQLLEDNEAYQRLQTLPGVKRSQRDVALSL